MDYCGEDMSLVSSSTRINMYFKAKKKRFLFSSIAKILFFVVGVFYLSVFVSKYSMFKSVSSCSSPNCNSPQCNYSTTTTQEDLFDLNLYNVLLNASTKDKTVIITNVNEAWAKKNSLLDLFMESIKTGNGTLKYLNHLVIVCIDRKAYQRCLTLHPHCYKLNTTHENGSSTEAHYMSESYLKIVWNKVYLLKIVLEMGFNFLLTDCDIMWLQDPFPRFFPEGDIQTSCDEFNGNHWDHNNLPNTGFSYVKSNEKTIHFFKYWYSSRLIHPNEPNQPVFNIVRKHPYILEEIGLKFVFLDTKYIGGFCQPTNDISLACTMHASCCCGLRDKISDLKLVLQDWRNSSSSPSRAPLSCRPPQLSTPLQPSTKN